MKNLKKIFIIMIALIVIVPSSIVFAKYIFKINSLDQPVKTSIYYFTSDKLFETTKEYTIVTDTISEFNVSFSLNNFKDTLNYANTDIEYQISYYLESDPTSVLSKTGTINKHDDHGNSVLISINLNEFVITNTQEVLFVKATSLSPFKKDLSAKFIIQKSTELTKLDINDTTSNIAIATLTVGNKEGQVVIHAPNGYLPDPTNYYGTVDITNRTITINVTSYSSYQFIFLKNNPNNVITSGFNCSINSEEVVVNYV